MAYSEPADPLTGKGHRHAIASTLATLGLGKSIIAEPEPEIEEREKTGKLPALFWRKASFPGVEATYLAWESIVIDETPRWKGGKTPKLVFKVTATKERQRWEVVYEIQWQRGQENYNRGIAIKRIPDLRTKEESIVTLNKIMKEASINDIHLITNKDTEAEIFAMVNDEFGRRT